MKSHRKMSEENHVTPHPHFLKSWHLNSADSRHTTPRIADTTLRIAYPIQPHNLPLVSNPSPVIASFLQSRPPQSSRWSHRLIPRTAQQRRSAQQSCCSHLTLSSRCAKPLLPALTLHCPRLANNVCNSATPRRWRSHQFLLSSPR